MMKNSLNYILLPLMLLFSFVSYAQLADRHIVDKTINEFMAKNNIPGVAVEIYVDGKPQSYYYGYAIPEKKVPISKNTIFEIGSLTKLMTSLLLAQEVDAAKVQLDDSITKYMKDLPKQYEEISLQSLATYSAGLPFNVPDTVTSQAELNQYLMNWKPAFAADEKWAYSNISMGILGKALEQSTHKKYSQLLRAHILTPLGMQPIGFDVPKKLSKYYAQGFNVSNQAVPPMKLSLFPEAGAMKASAGDMQRFLSAAVGLSTTPRHVLYPILMTQAAYLQLPNRLQGLGWSVHSLKTTPVSELLTEPETMNFGPLPVENVFDRGKYDANSLIDKTGATNGFRSYIAVIPNKKSGVVILTNKYVSNGEIVKTGREILFKLTKLVRE